MARTARPDSAGLRVTSLEKTIVDLLARPSRRGGVWLASELLRTESALERRSVDVAALGRVASAHPRAAVRRRVAWLCARAGHDALARRLLLGALGGPIALDPLGAKGGPIVAGYRLRLNTADGFQDPVGAVAADLLLQLFGFAALAFAIGVVALLLAAMGR